MPKIWKTMKPSRMWIDGKCFNILPRKNSGKKQISDIPAVNLVEEYNINSIEDGVFNTSFKLPSLYYTKIKTHNIFNIKHLENNTNTKIEIPKVGTNGAIQVQGNTIEAIVEARNELQTIVSDIRDKSMALQFIAIPTLSEEIKENFILFKNGILEKTEEIEGIHESIFQSKDKLHLTVVVFSLLDELEKKEAVNTLNDCKISILDPIIAKTGPLRIKVSGIDCMTANVKKTNVLFANAEIINETEEFNLQDIANKISAFFYDRGLVRQYQDKVKLHVTLMNTKYRKSGSEENSPIKKKKWFEKRKSFDASSIMEKYKDFYFGEVTFDSIHLSLISSKGDDGFYQPISFVKF